MGESLFSRSYFDAVYIPAGLIVFGTWIMKKEFVPYAAAIAVALAGFKFYGLQPKKVLIPDTFQEFELSEKTIISHNVAIYRFKLPSPTSILGLPIGQHISIGATISKDDGTSQEVVRSYTPISGDDQPGHFDLLVKSYPTGNISKNLAGLAIGQTIRVRGPKGAFVYTPNMVVKAIIRGRAAGDKTEVDLIFANVTEQDILLREDLDALTKEDAGIRVHYKYLPKPAEDVKILLCGPPPMVSGLKKATEALGYKKARPVSKLEDQVFAF
ncbi:unnamed protein product [Parascedosporium putredinis]|uniref:cytochrome-b5 reductase n=1 Tax=Parascedosporium putredinis TaxID=1442378 RepID=A0A9P1HBY0_9PEZI|nr:unnamed protein product [Parascedosporium putredinis]CAI8003223.1 unnamed protein product [Parascedosporium putredinis]